MKDGIIKGEGNSRLLKCPPTIPNTWDEFRNQLIAGSLPVDLLFNSVGWEVIGTLLSKGNLFSDAVAELYGLSGGDATVNRALEKILTEATQTLKGLMSTTDKTKLDGVAQNANNYVHPATSGNKHMPSGGTVGQILQNTAGGTATWQDLVAAEVALSAVAQALIGVADVDLGLQKLWNETHNYVVETIISSKTWTTPITADYDVFIVGGGGGGSSGSYFSNNATFGGGGAGGGGGECLFIPSLRLTAGTNIACVIGAGGAGGISVSGGTDVLTVAGSDGGVTSFRNFTAIGGLGSPPGTSSWRGMGGKGTGGGGAPGENSSVAGAGGDGSYGANGVGSGAGKGRFGEGNLYQYGFCPINGVTCGSGGGGGAHPYNASYLTGANGGPGAGKGGDAVQSTTIIGGNGGNGTANRGGGGGGGARTYTVASTTRAGGNGGTGGSGVIIIGYHKAV